MLAARAVARGPVKWVEDRQENLAAGFQGHEQRYHVRAGVRRRRPDARPRRRHPVRRRRLLDAPVHLRRRAADGGDGAARPLPRCSRYRARGPRGRHATRRRWRRTAASRARRSCSSMERLLQKAALRARPRPRRDPPAQPDPGRRLPVRPTPTASSSTAAPTARRSSRCADGARLDGLRASASARPRDEGRLLGLGISCFAERTGYGTEAFAQRKMAITPGYDTRARAHGPVGRRDRRRRHLGPRPGPPDDVRPDRRRPARPRPRPRSRCARATPTRRRTAGARSRAARWSSAAAPRTRPRPARSPSASSGSPRTCSRPRRRTSSCATARAVVRGAPGHERRVRGARAARLPRDPQAARGRSSPASRRTRRFDPPGTFSNATHGAIVEIDPDTGAVAIERYVVVEDCGVMINPPIVEGQVRGGVAQGIAAALFEELIYARGRPARRPRR